VPQLSRLAGFERQLLCQAARSPPPCSAAWHHHIGAAQNRQIHDLLIVEEFSGIERRIGNLVFRGELRSEVIDASTVGVMPRSRMEDEEMALRGRLQARDRNRLKLH
jgi:hypothetical protein